MGTFLTTHGTAFHIEQIIAQARARLVLICPYLQLSKTLLERLQDADRNGVKTTLVYGKSELSRDQQGALQQLRGLTLYFLQNLHAKCYFNEKQMVITSMNLYEFSEKTNREMGVLVESTESVYEDAVKEARSIVAAATGEHGTRPKDDDPGFCIRCSKRIAYDPDVPYCERCGEVWSQFENENYREEYCHSCGRAAETRMNRPLCSRCYREEGY
jgi:hypothetical protein